MGRPKVTILRRLMLLILAAALVPSLTLVGTSLYLGGHARADAERNVDATLNLAIALESTLIEKRLTRMLDRAVSLAQHPEVGGALSGLGRLSQMLEWSQAAFPDSDLITVVNRNGVVQGRITSGTIGDRLSYGGLIAQVIDRAKPAAAIERVPQRELEAEGAQLMNQIRVPIRQTPEATDSRVGTVLEDALTLVGVAPVIDGTGKVLGAVIVGDVLNNDFRIVDDVRNQSPLGVPINATIAMDGIRVTTNVPESAGGQRAVGTLYSDIVMEKLRAGLEYRGRAVVGGWQWQRTIYLPLRDHKGEVIAGSYVGIPEATFMTVTGKVWQVALWGVIIAAATLILSLIFAYLLAQNRVVHPLRHLTELVQAGNLQTRIAVRTPDEMGELAGAINSLLDRVRHTVLEISRVSHGVKDAISHMLGAAHQTRSNADSLLEEAGAALTLAEQVGTNAREAAERVRALELTLARVSTGAADQARGVLHARSVIGEVDQAVRASRDVINSAVLPSREAFGLAQDARQAILRTLSALELLELAAAEAADAAQQPVQRRDPGALELEESRKAVRMVDQSVHRIADAAGEALNRLWELAGVLSENGARIGAVTQQMTDVSAVMNETAQTTQVMGDLSRQIIMGVQDVNRGSREVVSRFRQTRDRVNQIAQSNQRIEELAERIGQLAAELEAGARQFPQQ